MGWPVSSCEKCCWACTQHVMIPFLHLEVEPGFCWPERRMMFVVKLWCSSRERAHLSIICQHLYPYSGNGGWWYTPNCSRWRRVRWHFLFVGETGWKSPSNLHTLTINYSSWNSHLTIVRIELETSNWEEGMLLLGQPPGYMIMTLSITWQ